VGEDLELWGPADEEDVGGGRVWHAADGLEQSVFKESGASGTLSLAKL
jgi:hypothetical protein